MRIASWNVNSVRTRLDQVLTWLKQAQPDVLCLQETKVADELFPHAAFEELGYSCAISGQKAYNGVALISRLPIEDVQIGFTALLPNDPEASALSDQKRVISALIDGVRVLNLYVPNGSSLSSEKYPYKLQWLGCLKRYLERGRKLRLIRSAWWATSTSAPKRAICMIPSASPAGSWPAPPNARPCRLPLRGASPMHFVYSSRPAATGAGGITAAAPGIVTRAGGSITSTSQRICSAAPQVASSIRHRAVTPNPAITHRWW